MRIGFPDRYAKGAPRIVTIAALLLALPAAAVADAAGPYYERSFVLAANDKCRLFAPALASALTASALQARGAAVRAGTSEADLAATAARARARAAGTLCDDPQLALVRSRVSDAFAGWSRTPRMTFPGRRADWSADRSGFSSSSWRLVQTSVTGASPVAFGFAARDQQGESLKAVVSFIGRPRPYAARIVMRNVERAPRPWLAGSGVAALPPEAARRTFFATGSTAADPTLLSAERSEGQAWAFPAAAADALAALDPREPFVVEFLFRDDSVARATFEAGDFAAGRAFIGMGSL